MTGAILSGAVTLLPFAVSAASSLGGWETLGLGGFAAFLVWHLANSNTKLTNGIQQMYAEQAKTDAQHKQELVKLVADMSISQTVHAEAIKDVAVSESALAKALEMVAKAFDRNTEQIGRQV